MAIEDAGRILFDRYRIIMTDTEHTIIKKEKIASPSDGLEISILLCGHNTHSGSARTSPAD